MSEKVDIFMPLFVADYDRDTSDLSFEEHGFYLAILRALWVRGGVLVLNRERLARTLRTDAETFDRLWAVTSRFFVIEDSGAFTQKRLSIELARAMEMRRAASEAGKRSAAARAEKAAAEKAKSTTLPGSLERPSEGGSVEPTERGFNSSPSESHSGSLSSGSSLPGPVASDPDPEARAIHGAPPLPAKPYDGPKLQVWLMSAWTAARAAEFGGTGFGAGNGIPTERWRDYGERLAQAPEAVPYVDASMRKFWADVKAGRHDQADKCAKTAVFAAGVWWGLFAGDFEAAIGAAPVIPKAATARGSPRPSTADAFAELLTPEKAHP